MELSVVKKIKAKDNIIATFGNGTGFVKIQEAADDGLVERLKSLSSDKIKQMIVDGGIDSDDIIDLLDKRSKSERYLLDHNTKFVYKDKTVFPIPDLNRERELIYIHGSSGSGKSWWTKCYAKLYRKYHKENDVFVLSHVKKDPSFEGLKYDHIPIDEETLNNVDLETFKDSLVIFDDTDTPKDKVLQKLIDSLKDDIAQRGRHHNISAIFTTHMACNFIRTRVLLNECDKFVVFPGNGGNKQQEYMVCNYGGMDKKFFNSLKSLKSRWVMFNVRYPNYIVYQSGVTILG